MLRFHTRLTVGAGITASATALGLYPSFTGCLASSTHTRTRSKHLLVTGGSNGIGAAIAKDYGCEQISLTDATLRHKVFVTGRNVEDLISVVNCITASGGIAAYGVGDVSSEADVKRLYGEAKEFLGHVDVLVANAGCGGGRSLLEDTELDKFERQHSTNVKGVFLWLKTCLPDMKQLADKFEPATTCQIIVTSSVAGKRACPMSSVYASTKWAVEGMILSLRKELEMTGSKVKCGTINPAAVRTKWWSEPERGGRFPGYDTSPTPTNMLTAEDCAKGAR
jgi:NAD(P)-dependent dehydrogenase (short-subunit alcohol dehydrogenase family)